MTATYPPPYRPPRCFWGWSRFVLDTPAAVSAGQTYLILCAAKEILLCGCGTRLMIDGVVLSNHVLI